MASRKTVIILTASVLLFNSTSWLHPIPDFRSGIFFFFFFFFFFFCGVRLFFITVTGLVIILYVCVWLWEIVCFMYHWGNGLRDERDGVLCLYYDAKWCRCVFAGTICLCTICSLPISLFESMRNQILGVYSMVGWMFFPGWSLVRQCVNVMEFCVDVCDGWADGSFLLLWRWVIEVRWDRMRRLWRGLCLVWR